MPLAAKAAGGFFAHQINLETLSNTVPGRSTKSNPWPGKRDGRDNTASIQWRLGKRIISRKTPSTDQTALELLIINGPEPWNPGTVTVCTPAKCYFKWSILAAKIKSFSVNPPEPWVVSVNRTSP
jgi:hypothetical protein